MNRWSIAMIVLSAFAYATPATAAGVQERGAATCQVTEPVAARGRFSTQAGPWTTSGLWHIDPERRVWALIGGTSYAGGTPRLNVLRSEARNQLLWIRPADVELVVTARRTDAEAPPARARFTADTGEATASEIVFPTAGCWEITAMAETSRLTFIVWVEPPMPPLSGRAR